MPLNFDPQTFTRQSEPGQAKGSKPLSYWLKQRKILTNLIVMTLVWLSCSFNFYLIQFLLTSFEQVYSTTILSSLSDILGY